ncbi:MAG TPA: hypothetical protein VJ572_11655 [Azonexus sp.]|nr:hypothetical protein [Azonexus sp.]
MEPDKSKPMSILSDLDPKNTRFRDTPSSGKNSKLVWMLALLPFLAGAVWMVTSLQPGMNTSGDELRTMPAVGQARAASADPTPAGAAQAAALAASEKPAEGAALIVAAADPQGRGTADREAGTNVFQAMQKELEKPASRQPSADTAGQPADRQAVKETKAKKAQANAKPAAGARTKTANKGNEGYRASRNVSKPAAERDIDIISAIVR